MPNLWMIHSVWFTVESSTWTMTTPHAHRHTLWRAREHLQSGASPQDTSDRAEKEDWLRCVTLMSLTALHQSHCYSNSPPDCNYGTMRVYEGTIIRLKHLIYSCYWFQHLNLNPNKLTLNIILSKTDLGSFLLQWTDVELYLRSLTSEDVQLPLLAQIKYYVQTGIKPFK